MNGEDSAAIKDALAKVDDGIYLVQSALAGWQLETKPVAALANGPLKRLIDEHIGGFIRLTMSRCDREARQEFSEQLILELAEVPVSLVEPALAVARRKISYPEKLVPFIFEFIEARWEKLKTEGERLAKLVELAG